MAPVSQELEPPTNPGRFSITRYEDRSGVGKDLIAAEKWLLQAAKQGHIGAQLQLANLYYEGPDDRKRLYFDALKWFDAALPLLYEAEKTASRTMKTNLNRMIGGVEYKIANIYYQECSLHFLSFRSCGPDDTFARVLKDPVKAKHWFYLSAERGNKEAQYDLAGMYELGSGIPQNFEEAIKWYEKAALNGFDNARCPLGPLYSKLGNYVAAHMWFNLAQSATVMCNEEALVARDAVAKLMTSEQVATAQRNATDWAEKKH